jgi:Lipopolysaccharide-assembly
MKTIACGPISRGLASLRVRRTARSLLALVLLAAAGLLAGCTNLPTWSPSRSSGDDGGFLGWHMQAPFDTSDAKTVFVYFKSNRFRRDLQLMLTEAVTKEISMRTPYRVVGNPEQADAILSGTITVDDKNLIVEAPTNLPRQLATMLTVWINLKHNPPLETEKDQQPAAITDSFQFVPEIGQTAMTSFQQSTENIAKQIVDMMERPWFDETDLQ